MAAGALEPEAALTITAGVFAGDDLITFGRPRGFLEDKPRVIKTR